MRVRLTHKWSLIATTAVFLVCLAAMSVHGQTTLTIDEVRSRALQFNRQYLSAQQDINLSQAEIVKARSGALPSLHLNGYYNRNFKIPSFFVQAGDETIEFKTGFKNSFGATVSLEQPIWQGGRVINAYLIARMYKRYSEAAANQVKANVIYNAESLFYVTVLRRAQLAVLRQAYEANKANYDVVQKLYSRGMVSEYELLRAEVERDNLLPQIIRAESEVNLADKQLKSFLGIDLTEGIAVVEGEADTAISGLPALAELTRMALKERPEMLQAEELVQIADKAIGVARGGYWPDFSAIAQYDWQSQSDSWTLSENKSESWTAGLRVSFPLFEGWRTHGEVNERKAQYEQAKLARQQTLDDIRLEVEAAYDRLMQAKKSLDIQKTTIAQAEEGLKIANLRYNSGVGTQLEVLSAQTALTDARRARAEALFLFRQARAGLKKATTVDILADSGL